MSDDSSPNNTKEGKPMALIQCPECGGKLSDQAKVCKRKSWDV